MRRLEYVGPPSPFLDMAAFVADVRRRSPRISDRGVDEVVARTLQARKPRFDGRVVHLFGADILTDDLDSITARRWALDTDIQILAGLALEQRRTRIDPAGLSRTYVWRKENGWMQEVTDHDVEIIRHSEARLWFRDPERADDPFRPVRSHDVPVIDQQEFTSWGSFEDFERDQKRVPHWAGA